MTPELAELLKEITNIETRVRPLFDRPMRQFDGYRALNELGCAMGDIQRAVRGIIPELALIDNLFHAGWQCAQSDGDENEVDCINFSAMIEELSNIALLAKDCLVADDHIGLFHSPLGDIHIDEPTCCDDFGITDEIKDLILMVEAWVEYQRRDALSGSRV